METARNTSSRVRAAPNHRARVLDGITGTLRQKLGRPRAMRSIIARTCRVIGADRGSVFLLHEDRRLRGAYEISDWTRSSFAASVEDWPSVNRSLSSNLPLHIAGPSASGIEAEWFGSEGIAGCLCTPLIADGRQIGVIFWDFLRASGAPPSGDTEFAQSVAALWAAAIVVENARADVLPSNGVTESMSAEAHANRGGRS